MQCLAVGTALPPGRGDRAPPRKSSFALFPGSPRKAISPGLTPPEGRALHAREGMPWLHPGTPPLGHRPLDYSSLVTPYPPLAYGPAARARRPRPSEKTPLRVISRFSPLGHASWACLPAEGRAPHARDVGMAPYRCISPLKPLVLLLGPARESWFHPGMPPLGHRPLGFMVCRGLCTAPRGGAGSARP
jgi:hypothetical protein